MDQKILAVPEDITLSSIAVDVRFHPKKELLAVGDIDGDVTIHSYSLTEKNHLLMTFPHHKKACRAVRFSPDGSLLYTVSKDKSLQAVDIGKGAVTRCVQNAHESPIYSLLAADENIVITGDDDGHLKIWDMRYKKAVLDAKENDDFISDLALEDKRRYLLASSGDGTLTSFDIRKHKMKLQSELFDCELLSVAIIKGGEKVVSGSGDGILQIFNWGEWGNISDRFPGHSMSIDCIVPISRDVICTGSMDGIIRTVQILPNQFLQDVGRHADLPVESLSLSHCRLYLASCAHDERVRIWKAPDPSAPRQSKGRKGNACAVNTSSFFADLEEPATSKTAVVDNDNSDDDDDSDHEEADDHLTSSDDSDSPQQPTTADSSAVK